MEDDVVGHVAEAATQCRQTVAQADADCREIGQLRGVEVPVVAARDGQHLERRATPVGADHDDAIVGVDDAGAGVELGLDRGTQQARAGEPVEPELLADDLAGDEREPEELPVRVDERRTGFAAVVDDRLAVAELGHRRVGLGTSGNGRHHVFRLLVVDVGPRRIVRWVYHQHFVHPRRIGLGEDRPEMLDDHRLATFEGRIEVRNDQDTPTPVGTGSHQRGRLGFGTTGAERARAAGIGLDIESAGLELVGALTSFGVDRDPSAGQRIKSELTHVAAQVS